MAIARINNPKRVGPTHVKLPKLFPGLPKGAGMQPPLGGPTRPKNTLKKSSGAR